MSLPPELDALLQQLDAADQDARALVGGLNEATGTWRAAPGTWSVAECLEHLALSNQVYLAAMIGAADRARAAGRLRRGPAVPGIIGGWFVRSLEPQKGLKLKAARVATPRPSPALTDAYAAFVASQEQVRRFIQTYADLDLAGVRFPNPFVRGIRFSLATGLHVIPAHERRHLWQARQVLRAATL